MKRNMAILLLLIIVFSLVGCRKKEEKIGIRGEITEINIMEEEIISILVEGDIEEDIMYDKANVEIKNSTKIYKDEEKLRVEELKEGQTVEVIFDGAVAESHPVQGLAKSIQIVE